MEKNKTDDKLNLAENLMNSIEGYVDIRIRDVISQINGRYDFHVKDIKHAREHLVKTIRESLKSVE